MIKKTFELCRSLKSGILAMRKEWNNIMQGVFKVFSEKEKTIFFDL